LMGCKQHGSNYQTNGDEITVGDHLIVRDKY
jgi:hypothetical protein